MNKPIVTILLWFSAIGTCLIAGVFFAFSTFIMTALDRSGQVHGIVAMNSINSTILHSPFMPIFFGTTLTSAVLAVIAMMHRNQSGATAALAAGVIYVLGVFVCTLVGNVPLNNALAAIDPQGTDGAVVWARYLKDWTFWNHVRTVAALAASALFTFALRVGA